MFTVFPRSDYKRIEDVTWIPKVTENGWPILAKDAFDKKHERKMIVECGARVFSLPNANMKTQQMIDRFLDNEERIMRACERDGPFQYAVSHDRLRVVKLTK